MNVDDVLFEFLSLPLETADPVFERFRSLPGAVFRGKAQARFLYVPGTRADRALLVAHADTVWDRHCERHLGEAHEIMVEDGIVHSTSMNRGLGADDRAGCAMLWLMRNLGHSLLITDGEEYGRQGSVFLMDDPVNRDIASQVGKHSFIVQFDRQGDTDFKCYNVGTEEFRGYIRQATGMTEPDRRSFTDIVTLCREIPGVNMSVGYYKAHGPGEYLVVAQWQRLLGKYSAWLQGSLPSFHLPKLSAAPAPDGDA